MNFNNQITLLQGHHDGILENSVHNSKKVQGLMNHTFSSIDYGMWLKKAEDDLLEAEKDGDIELQIKTSQVFETFYKNIPQGPGVLLQRDLALLGKLFVISPNEKYCIKNQTYYEPKVSLSQIVEHFSQFKEDFDFSGVSVAMKRDHFYNYYKGKMMTLVGFMNPKEGRVMSFIKSFGFNLEDPKDIEESLNKLANEKFSEWGFDKFKVILPEDITIRRVREKIKNENKYRCFVIFFHKIVQSEINK